MSGIWVLWGIPKDQLWLAPAQLSTGVYEDVVRAQEGWRSIGWVTGPYRQGFEPLGLLQIQSSNLLDKDRQTGETEPMTSNYVLGAQESHNRAVKATAMLHTLERHHSLSLEEIEDMGDKFWQALAQLSAAEQQPPADWTDASPQTRATVIGILRGREATPDPFQGFPK